MMRGSMIGLAALALLAAGAPVGATVMFDFECDVPPNRLSAVDHPIAAMPAELSGTIAPVIARSGRFLPRAGARINSADDSQSIGFQIVSLDKMEDGFTVFRTVTVNGLVKREPAGRIPAGMLQIPFSISVGPDGAARFAVGPVTAAVALKPFAAGKSRVLCTGGQFGFRGVKLR